MSSASNGRKNRPRSAGNIFQIGKPPYRDPQRRESTESTRKAQRAVADCRMVGLRHVNACMVLLIRSAVLLSFFVLGQSTIPCMQDAQATAVNSCRKKKKNTVTRSGSLKIAICICIALLPVKPSRSSRRADWLCDLHLECGKLLVICGWFEKVPELQDYLWRCSWSWHYYGPVFWQILAEMIINIACFTLSYISERHGASLFIYRMPCMQEWTKCLCSNLKLWGCANNQTLHNGTSVNKKTKFIHLCALTLQTI